MFLMTEIAFPEPGSLGHHPPRAKMLPLRTWPSAVLRAVGCIDRGALDAAVRRIGHLDLRAEPAARVGREDRTQFADFVRCRGWSNRLLEELTAEKWVMASSPALGRSLP